MSDDHDAGKPEHTPESVLTDLLMIPRGEVNLSQVLGMHPDILVKLVIRAQGLVNQGLHDEAEEMLHDLCRVERGVPNLPFLLGVCRYQQHDMAGAVEAYTQALERGQLGATRDFVQQVYICRAQALLQLGEFQRAAEDLQHATEGGDANLAEHASSWLAQLKRSTTPQ